MEDHRIPTLFELASRQLPVDQVSQVPKPVADTLPNEVFQRVKYEELALRTYAVYFIDFPRRNFNLYKQNELARTIHYGVWDGTKFEVHIDEGKDELMLYEYCSGALRYIYMQKTSERDIYHETIITINQHWKDKTIYDVSCLVNLWNKRSAKYTTLQYLNTQVPIPPLLAAESDTKICMTLMRGLIIPGLVIRELAHTGDCVVEKKANKENVKSLRRGGGRRHAWDAANVDGYRIFDSKKYSPEILKYVLDYMANCNSE